MATFLRVDLLCPIKGVTKEVVAAPATFAPVLTGEVAVVVGDDVPAMRAAGSEGEEILKLLSRVPRSGITITSGQRRALVAAMGTPADKIVAATKADSDVVDEAHFGLVFGTTAAGYLARSGLVEVAVGAILKTLATNLAAAAGDAATPVAAVSTCPECHQAIEAERLEGVCVICGQELPA